MNILQANLNFRSNIKYGNKVEKIIFHNSGSDVDTVIGMHSYHQSQGWAGIGYHYVIDPAGNTYQTRQDNVQGCHAGNANYNSIGICCIGNINNHALTDVQLKAAKELAKSKCQQYGLSANDIYGHNNFMNTDCPGRYFPLNEIKSYVNGKKVSETVKNNERKKECKLLSKCKGNVIVYGSKGNYVCLLQSALNAFGYNLVVDGSAGPATIAAIKDYQSKNGLVVDGSCGPATWTSILE